MPIFKVAGKLVYYAHVPKCGGSAVAKYLRDRFGSVAFSNNDFHRIPSGKRWSKTSPQHIDANALDELFPADFFDACFTIVRHPVARIISDYHFQKEVERLVPQDVSFSEWLLDVAEMLAVDRFSFDNHIRPMAEMVPQGAEVFYMEHGLDALIPWLDSVTGIDAGPRQFDEVNKRGDFRRTASEKVVPSESDLALILEIYAADFKRFGYRIDSREPDTPAPALPPAFQDEISRRGPSRPNSMLGAALKSLRKAL